MEDQEIYIIVPRKITPLTTDFGIARQIKNLRLSREIAHVAIDESLNMPVTKRYCEKNGISYTQVASNEDLIERLPLILQQDRRVACVCAYSPPEGITEELKNNLRLNRAELSFL